MKATIFFICGLLLLTACQQEQQITGEAIAVPVVVGGEQLHNKPAAQQQTQPTVREFEVMLDAEPDYGASHEDGSVDRLNTNTEEENFFPKTFIVNQGDTVVFDFLFEEVRFISIETYGIAEHVRSETLEFKADKSGRHSIICLDCPSTPEAVLIVN